MNEDVLRDFRDAINAAHRVHNNLDSSRDKEVKDMLTKSIIQMRSAFSLYMTKKQAED